MIDSGLARFCQRRPQRGLDRLELRPDQPGVGHAARGPRRADGPGRCVRLWSEREHRGLAESDPPEVQRVDLCG